jgi:hypothetical protein
VSFVGGRRLSRRSNSTIRGKDAGSIRYALRDAVECPTFDRGELAALLEAQTEVREGQTTSADEACDRVETDDE